MILQRLCQPCIPSRTPSPSLKSKRCQITTRATAKSWHRATHPATTRSHLQVQNMENHNGFRRHSDPLFQEFRRTVRASRPPRRTLGRRWSSFFPAQGATARRNPRSWSPGDRNDGHPWRKIMVICSEFLQSTSRTWISFTETTSSSSRTWLVSTARQR